MEMEIVGGIVLYWLVACLAGFALGCIASDEADEDGIFWAACLWPLTLVLLGPVWSVQIARRKGSQWKS